MFLNRPQKYTVARIPNTQLDNAMFTLPDLDQKKQTIKNNSASNGQKVWRSRIPTLELRYRYRYWYDY